MTSVYTRQTTAEGALNQNAPLTNEQLDANFINLNNEKQASLVSGTNIKTVNGASILGPGDLELDVSWDNLENKPAVIAAGADAAAARAAIGAASQTALNDKAPIAHVGSGGTAHADAVASGDAGFMSGADKAKLDGIASGANNYSHPADHPPSIIAQDSSNRFVTDAEKTAWDAKQDALVSGTNIKTINGTSLLGSGDIATGEVTLTGTQTLINKTITETVFAVTGTTPALTATNGAVQTWTLTAASTPTNALTSGQSIILVITPGAYAITWPSVTWTKQGGSGTAPTLFSAGKTSVVLWMVGAVLYGSHLGDTV